MSNTIRGTSKEYPQHMLSLRNKKYQYVLVEKKHHILTFVISVATITCMFVVSTIACFKKKISINPQLIYAQWTLLP